MKYETIKITDQIIAVKVKNQYDRAMLFCRVQEFYESPSKKFKNNKFSIWEYFKWYSESNKNGCFSYTKDFTGYNFPLIIAKKCYEINEIETPYDEIMKNIVDRYFVNGQRKYIIGIDSMKNSTFEHEMCHAFYYVDEEYRIKMDEITKSVPERNKKKLKKNLLGMGYCSAVFKDEMQAYMATEINKRFCAGVSGCRSIHRKYRAIFKNYI